MKSNQAPLIACEECGLIVRVAPLEPGQKASCPRCEHSLTTLHPHPVQGPIAIAIAALIALVASLSFPFMSFSVKGLKQEIFLMNAASMLSEFHNTLLALLLLLTILVLPGIYLVTIIYTHWQIRSGKAHHIPAAIRYWVMRVLTVKPWLMVDVFLIGVLVSLVKIASLAEISMGLSFWAYCVYSVLVVKAVAMVDRAWLWNQLMPMPQTMEINAGEDHRHHISCHHCTYINAGVEGAHCVRCGMTLHGYHPQRSLQQATALLIASAICYIPANLYPMMYTLSLGKTTGSTIMGGVALLWQLKSYPIAAIIFIASVLIPLAKMIALAWLFWQARKDASESTRSAIQNLKLYRLTEFIGRWSMIDIFVVAILVSLVQLQKLMAIYPGPAALSFAAVVILTMLSAMVFDPRIFWNQNNIVSYGNSDLPVSDKPKGIKNASQ
uniref:paraquat-inducible protein A n=1 Tax=Thaumasiovibrio occultus TaxID=1891184 RepID=UPI000B35DE4A|nr:paraquat-inducible protein A [Thaumasiovibrio occultus]